MQGFRGNIIDLILRDFFSANALPTCSLTKMFVLFLQESIESDSLSAQRKPFRLLSICTIRFPPPNDAFGIQR